MNQEHRDLVIKARESDLYKEIIRENEGVWIDFYPYNRFIVKALEEDGFDVVYTINVEECSSKIKINKSTERQFQSSEHKCTGTQKYNREIVRGTEDWIMIHEHDEYENIDVTTEGLKYCPWCGVKLDEA